ncbi:hypothetical protein R1flu_025164 [Riccia fluitans]|uniref:C3H1-type domain-containing protein n=1 Tax=Riccia fluitans TaxID=41844 RepID=A0ABD1XX04_9MARC
MAHARDLYKTKLCTLYQRGNCPRQSCSFAHGEAELRRFTGGGGFIGRSHSRSSPRRSRNSRSFSPERSPPYKRRESKRMKLEQPDVHLSDVSDHYAGDGKLEEEDNARSSARSPSPSPRDEILDQLRQVQAEKEVLLGNKSKLEKYLEKMKEEQGVISAKNAELESKLNSSQEELKRWNGKVKKLVKLYMRNVRAQEEVKKTHARLQKFAEDLSGEDNSRVNTHGDDSDYYNLSDVEPERVAKGAKAEVSFGQAINAEADAAGQNGETPGERERSPLHDSLAIAKKKRLHAVREKTRALTRNMQQNGGTIKLKSKEDDTVPDSDVTAGPLMASGGSEKPSKVDMFMPIESGASKERIAGDDLSLSLRSSPTEKVRPVRSTLMLFAVKSRDVRSSLPTTGLAAHAGDIEVDEENRASDKYNRNPNLDLELGKSYQIDADSSYRHPSPQLRVQPRVAKAQPATKA